MSIPKLCDSVRVTNQDNYRTRVRSLGMLVTNSLTDSLTHWLTDSCLVNLIYVTLACKDDNSNLLRLLLLLMLMMRNVLTTVWCRFWRWSLVLKLSFCSDFEHKISRFGQDFEVDVQARFWNWCLVIILLLIWSSILVEIVKLGLVKIF